MARKRGSNPLRVYVPPIPEARPPARTSVKVFIPERPVVLESASMRAAVFPGVRGMSFDCPYQCGGMRLDHMDGLEVHHYACPWWAREGQDETPFEVPGAPARALVPYRRK